METSETKAELFKAFANFKKKLKQPLKDANNPFFKSKYVPLENVVQVVDEAMTDTGLSYTQGIADLEEGYLRVDTIILHESGEYMIIKGSKVKPTKLDPQSAGSAITYARRYSLSTALGIASDPDDDGNGASQQAKNNQQSKNTQQPKAQLKQPEITLDAVKTSLNDLVKKTNGDYTKISAYLLKQVGADNFNTLSSQQLFEANDYIKQLSDKADKK